MKQKKMLSLLLAVATLMSGLSLTAFAQEENLFVLEDPYMIEYSIGERGLNFSSEQAIQQVKEAFLPVLTRHLSVKIRWWSRTPAIWKSGRIQCRIGLSFRTTSC